MDDEFEFKLYCGKMPEYQLSVESTQSYNEICSYRPPPDKSIKIGIRPVWVKCNDSLPEKDKEVLCYHSNGYVCIGYRCCGDWFYDGNNPHSECTHWMPLPKPPEGL